MCLGPECFSEPDVVDRRSNGGGKPQHDTDATDERGDERPACADGEPRGCVNDDPTDRESRRHSRVAASHEGEEQYEENRDGGR